MDNDTALRLELIPAVERLLERHLGMAKEWFPHEMVPWSRGEDFTPGETWEPDRAPTTDVARRALAVNLLTEDNLPHYFRTISVMSDGDAWATWARRWTAEEGRHAIVIRLQDARLFRTRKFDVELLRDEGPAIGGFSTTELLRVRMESRGASAKR